MLRFLKRLAIGLGKTLAVLLLAFAAFVGYGAWAERSAESKVSALCASIGAGQDPAAVQDRAIADGADDARLESIEGQDTLVITYVGLPPFSRHLCLVQVQNGRVVSASRSHLD